MSSRAPLSDEAFGATYFPAKWATTASKIRRIVGEQLDIDVNRALPSDRFVQDLRIDDLDSLAAVTIVMKVEEEFGITITDNDTQSIITIEQLVNCVASKLDSKRSLPVQETGSIQFRLWQLTIMVAVAALMVAGLVNLFRRKPPAASPHMLIVSSSYWVYFAGHKIPHTSPIFWVITAMMLAAGVGIVAGLIATLIRAARALGKPRSRHG